jgi:hypothetical protein
MPTILACTDGSIYAASVYQHAAWAAHRLSAESKCSMSWTIIESAPPGST